MFRLPESGNLWSNYNQTNGTWTSGTFTLNVQKISTSGSVSTVATVGAFSGSVQTRSSYGETTLSNGLVAFQEDANNIGDQGANDWDTLNPGTNALSRDAFSVTPGTDTGPQTPYANEYFSVPYPVTNVSGGGLATLSVNSANQLVASGLAIAAQPPAAPAISGISPDNGVSSTDGITDTGALTIDGTAASGTTIDVYNGSTLIGTGSTGSGGTWTAVLGTALTPGNYTLTATATLAGLTSSASSGYAVDVNETAPTVSSDNRVGGSPSNAGSDQFTVVFSESVTGVSTSSFALTDTGTVGGSIGSVSGSGTSYTVTVNSVTGDGTMRLDLKGAGSNGIEDTAGNVPAAYTGGQTYTIEHTPPVVTSINRVGGAAPNNASSDQFAVAFSESVTGVDTSDFVLAETGSTGGSIASISGSGSSYTVMVNSVTGDGTLGLNLKSSGTGISDAAGNAISGGFTGQTYTVEHTPPSVASIDTVGSIPNNASSDQFTVVFSDSLGAVTGVSTTSFQLAETGTASGSINSVSGSGDSYTVTVGSVTGDGTLGLNLKSSGTGISDAAGNGPTAGFTGQTYTIEHTAPSVTSIDTVGSASNNGGTEQFTVAFSESITGVDTSDFALADTGSVTGTIASVSGSGSSYTVTVTGASGNGTMQLDLKSSGTGITDPAGNAISSGFTGGETFTISPASGTPSISASSTATVGVNQSGSIGTVTIAESPTSGGETFTLILSDGNGALSANVGVPGGGGTITPSNGNKTLTISGTLAQVNADLTTLADNDATRPSDTIFYSLSDSNGGNATAASTFLTVNTAPAISATVNPLIVAQNQASALGGINVVETGSTTTSGETFTAVVSDGAGTLAANTHASGGGGTITSSNANMTLTISGTLAQVNADLTTLTDADASTASDTLTISATDSFGNSTTGATLVPINVTAAPVTFNAHVYLDGNGDGVQDAGDGNLAGVTVNLLDGSGNPTGQSLTTNSSGNVSFTGLAAGVYEVAVVPPSGDVVSQATNTFTPNTLGGGQSASATEGVYVPATFSAHVYNDANANGTQDGGDSNLPGVTVNLLNGSGTPTGQSSTTDSGGDASFAGLAPGSYEVQVVTPSGYAVTQAVNTVTQDTLASGGSASATEGVYAPPALTLATLSLSVGQGLSLGNLWSELVANGLDPNPSSLKITAVGTTGTQGSVSLSTATQSLTYLATGLNPSEPVDAFTYTLTDGSGGTVTGTVDVTVTGPSLPTSVMTTPGSTTTATGTGQRLISEGTRQTLVGSGAGGDELFGGSDTTIQAAGSGNTIDVLPGNHTITMGASNNSLALHDGNNSVNATGMGNTVNGGNGNNLITGMTGSVSITLGNGTDTVTISGGNNNVAVGTGKDSINVGTGGNGTVIAGDGANTISAGGPNDVITAGNGANKITATGLAATVTAGNGGNTIAVTGDGDKITTGSGNDTIVVTMGLATIKAGLGTNTIKFAASGNLIINQGGTDTLTDTGTNNTIVLPLAGQGLDTINGSVLANGDTFDLRSTLTATTWDQQMSDLGDYLTLDASGSNGLVQVSTTSGGTPITVAVLNGSGSVSLSSFVTHTLLT